MRVSSLVRVGCLGVLLAFAVHGRSDEPKAMEKFVGKWEATTGPIKGAVFEFGKDGALKLTVNGMTLEGKYKVASAEAVEFTLQEKTTKVPYKFDKNDLVLTGPDKKAMKFAKK